MRPVNLIPLEQRRGQNRPLRTGPVAYLVIGALVATLLGVTALVLTGNQIKDDKAEIVQLKREDTAAVARSKRLAPFSQFASLREQRLQTVTTLADSRFDWERVMRELALVLPHDVWLVNLTGTAAPGVKVGNGGSGESASAAGLRGAVPGPALEINGCASGQNAVAGFVTALKDIDGVTRVGVQSSKLPEKESGAGAAGGGGEEGGQECQTRDFIAKFQIVVGFDAAPIAPSSTEAPPVPAPTETASTTSTESTSSSETESSAGG
jgi:Tfp pilus assembly protein PilN